MLALADVALTVTNAKEAATWWKEKLGFEVHTIGAEGGHAVMVAPPGDRFVLHLCEGFDAVEPGNTGIAFISDAIEPLVQRMRSGGVSFPQELKKEAWGSHAKFADPDGHVFWLMEAPTPFLLQERERRAGETAPRPKPRRAPKAKKRTTRRR